MNISEEINLTTTIEEDENIEATLDQIINVTNTSKYTELESLPTYNGVTLTGDLKDILPITPTKLSELENDTPYTTLEKHNEDVENFGTMLNNLAQTFMGMIPTGVSQLENDSGYLTTSALNWLLYQALSPINNSAFYDAGSFVYILNGGEIDRFDYMKNSKLEIFSIINGKSDDCIISMGNIFTTDILESYEENEQVYMGYRGIEIDCEPNTKYVCCTDAEYGSTLYFGQDLDCGVDENSGRLEAYSNDDGKIYLWILPNRDNDRRSAFLNHELYISITPCDDGREPFKPELGMYKFDSRNISILKGKVFIGVPSLYTMILKLAEEANINLFN